MSALSRLFRSTFSTAAASTSVSETENAIVRSFSNEIFRERSLKRVVEKFKKASENDRFRTKTAIYKDTVRRLAAAKKFRYVVEIIENQKQYQDMSKEGFNARLISLYGTSGMFDNARKVFDEMLERKCAQTVLSFNALLGACVNSKKFDEVDGLFRGLSEELGIEPDLVSYNTVMKAFCEMGSLDSAVSLLDEMEKKGLKPDLITFNTILNGLYASGRFDDGERTWQRMKENNVKPDGRSYNEKLLGLALEKRMKDAAKVVEEMKSEGIGFDIFSYNALIRGFVNEDDLEKAKGWYSEISKTDCKPHKLTFKTLIPFVVEKGDVAFAFDLCKDVLSSKLAVKEALIQPVLDALAKESKINEAKELVELSKARRSDSLKLTLPSI
ncbi:hypothetical protein DKX38_005462 [Salix brachista]|uniref:Pentacotripeptide-repeat region of PRORP domain-containing protein n=1 Tax=Salix brachista TaxID=2182728 RepID=A0A5N5MZK8_9ROSI|nr:hypothetical protein DKX38_005462 [Salix brachista]